MGVTLSKLGDVDGALSALQEGIHILFPKRYTEKNVDLVALFYQCGVVKGQNGNYPAALYHLDLAKQVEIHIFGSTTEKQERPLQITNMLTRHLKDRIESDLEQLNFCNTLI